MSIEQLVYTYQLAESLEWWTFYAGVAMCGGVVFLSIALLLSRYLKVNNTNYHQEACLRGKNSVRKWFYFWHECLTRRVETTRFGVV